MRPATVVKMQQEIFKFVKRTAFPMNATTILDSHSKSHPHLQRCHMPLILCPCPCPIPCSCHACVNLRGAQLIFCKCFETHFWTNNETSDKGTDRGSRVSLSSFINCAQVLHAACNVWLEGPATATGRHCLPSC